MPRDDEVFTPEQVDEQIDSLSDALHFVSPEQPTAPEIDLIEHLHRHYLQAKADERILDAVWHRLTEQGALAPPPHHHLKNLPQHRFFSPGHTRAPSRPHAAAHSRPRLPSLIAAIAAVLLLTTLIGGLVMGLVLVRQHGPGVSHQPTVMPGQTPQVTPLPALAPPVVSYVGSDGNVWEMSLSQNKAGRVTADAQANSIHYSGLAWSPDGSMFAVLRQAIDPTTQQRTYTLLLLLPNGTVQQRVTLAGPLGNRPFAWSPDGKLIAYREATGQYIPGTSDHKEILHILNAQSGQEVKQLVFDQGPFGCGGGGYGAAAETMSEAHYSDIGGLDTFAWAPDQQTILVAYSCHNQSSEELDLNTGAVKSVTYPEGASYQPNGHLILGIWQSGPLGLVDFSNTHVRALVQRPSASSDRNYNQLGWANWSHDGQTIYYEYEDGIWVIGVDGSNPHQVVAGTPQDSQDVATIQLVPSLSSDDTLLLYLQAHGSTNYDVNPAPGTDQWYVAQADGTHPVPLPSGIAEVVWRP